MGAEGDQLISELIDRWREYEARLNVAINLRVFCYLAVVDSELGPRLTSWLSTMSGAQLSTSEVVGVLAGILWPRPAEIRGRSLDSYSPFHNQRQTDPSIVRDLLLASEEKVVAFGASSWREQLFTALSESGRVRLIAMQRDEEPFHRELLSLIATPVDLDYLQFYPVIEQAKRDGTTISLTLILREVVVT
jgi:hypothetical protein